MPAGPEPDAPWWKQGVIYQVYPRSFQDANGDGVGDLEGVIARLDHLVALGVDAVWLSPVYRSPMKDFGYDISDHTAIDPVFGDLPTFDCLLAEAHARGLRVIMDYVPNHTSEEHAWFRASRAGRTDAKRDWYIWRDPASGGGPPNNWRSEFGGAAWTFEPATGQYYYHAFLPCQPDLNWRHPDVAQAMLGVLAFWLERGVDGFRVDAIHHLFESEGLEDNPPNPTAAPGAPSPATLLRTRTVDQPEVHAAVAQMRALSDSFAGDTALIGEAYLPLDRLMAYYGGAADGFHLPFNFHLMSTPWQAPAIAALIADYEAKLPAHGWPNWVLGNHDRSRLASRVGPDQTRVAAMLLLTLRGTPTIYQGEELGMTDGLIPPSAVRDPWELNMPGQGLGRDPVRTPMPWSGAANAGFTSGSPWLPLNPDWAATNAAAQAADPASLFSFYRELLALRRSHPALKHGRYREVGVSRNCLVFERACGGERLVVALNFGPSPQVLELPAGEVLLSTGGANLPSDGLGANAGLILRPA